MNWKYIVVLAVVIILVLAGSVYIMANNPKSLPKQAEPDLEENVSNSVAPRLAIGVYREMLSSVSPDDVVEVGLNVAAGGAKYYVIEEVVPENWTIINAGSGAVDDNGHLKWVVLDDARDVVLRYSVVAPSKSGKYVFSGKYAIGSKDELFITGATQIIVS